MTVEDMEDALFEAVHGGDEDAVVRLLRAGVPAEAADGDGQTALYLAAVSGHVGIVRLLLAAGADPGRGSGERGGDLPLCGAACGGHTRVVRALLAAGARPDQREEFGFTALAWAVRQGFTDTVEALLEYGADPGLPGPAPGGEPPLVAAARRGSPSVVRALLERGAPGLEEALREALRWAATDVAEALRRDLVEAYGPGEYEIATRRVPEDGGVTVVVELLRDGVPGAGAEQQTGHAAIVTLLEGALGIRAGHEELAARALDRGDPGQDDWIESVRALWRRGDEETFRAAVAWTASDDPLRRAFAVDVLARLGRGEDAGEGEGEEGGDGTRRPARERMPFAGRAWPVLREVAREAREAELVVAVVAALGQLGDPAALPEILRHAAHPDAGVRRGVAVALTGLVPAGHREGVEALIRLSRDAEGEVRDWATLALAELPDDSPALREALAARLDDSDADTAAEAARGLAMRQDDRALEALARILGSEAPGGSARAIAEAALVHVRDERNRRRLEHTLPRGR
ncbi:ankyrin repeat domain-containing protein [Streptomyces sp. NPDC049837]|uniref:ankyrin repeat domain-containing protein n=1 Tax=Streptomyces sp. NPDC049837 TaxID=3155277 RepID=UPI00343A2EA2